MLLRRRRKNENIVMLPLPPPLEILNESKSCKVLVQIRGTFWKCEILWDFYWQGQVLLETGNLDINIVYGRERAFAK